MADDRKVDLLLTDLERLILSFFDAEPVSAQPKYVINVGGDCRVLGELDAVVRRKSLRGRMIEAAPLRLISIDQVGDGSVAVLELSGIERLTWLWGGEAPEQTIAALGEHGIEDPENALWVLNTSLFGAASKTMSARGEDTGADAVAVYATRSLPDRAQAWGRILRKHGLIILGSNEGSASACDVSGQLPRADAFLVSMAQSGLFPDPVSFRCYREAGAASVRTVGLFKLRDYCFRFAVEADLPTLVRLETEYWPPGLGMLPETVRGRIAGFREGRLGLEADNAALGVVYSQRVRTVEFAGCPDKQHDVLASATSDRAVQTHAPSLKNTYHRQRRRKSALVRSRASGGCRWQ